MARLYPPITEEVLSAFCFSYDNDGNKTGVSINVDFNLNRAVANSEIKNMALRLRTISTNQYVITENIENDEGIALSYDLTEGKCIFQITTENNPEVINKIKIGQYYRIQIAFIDINDDIGYWSSVATIKCVAKPKVTIANFDPTDANLFMNEIIGEYTQDTSTGDSSEKVYSYRFELYDNNDNLIDDTGIQLHNSSYDVSSNSSTDTFYCYEDLEDEKSYYVIYSIVTINGLAVSSPIYQIIKADSIEPDDKIKLIAMTESNKNDWHPKEEGLVKLYLDLDESNLRRAITGHYVISRSSSKDNFKTWEEIIRFRLVNKIPKNEIFYDYTVEQGITYHYAVQEYNKQQFYSKKILAYEDDGKTIKDIKVNFEDMFLYDGERQLKVIFNPNVKSFKNDLQEQKIDTIGSKHPFIFRNGNICYKEFPISGLISFQQDNAFLFIKDNDYTQMDLDRFEDIKFRLNSNSTDISLPSKTNLTYDNIATERYFKLLVLNWLTDGKPKVFRSPTEGNYIVRLLNVSLTPKNELGRMIHEFSCTAYEIADFNAKNLKDLGFLKNDDSNNLEELSYFNLNLKDIIKGNKVDEFYKLELNEKKIKTFECTNFAPNDKIKLQLEEDPEPIEILIGNAGTYIYDEGWLIKEIYISLDEKAQDFSRDILLGTQSYVYQKFDTIASITTKTERGKQIIGPFNNFLEKKYVKENYYDDDYIDSPNLDLLDGDGEKLKVSEILYLKAQKREIIPIFLSSDYGSLNPDSTFSLTPFGNGYIKEKTINNWEIPNGYWKDNIQHFTQEELIQERNIHNLVDFILSKQKNQDIFCLFKVYGPVTINQDDDNKYIYDWQPREKLLIQDMNNSFIKCGAGVFDAYLYQWQKERGCTDAYMGWWPLPGMESYFHSGQEALPYPVNDYIGYDPTITFKYEVSLNYIGKTITEVNTEDKKYIKLIDINGEEYESNIGDMVKYLDTYYGWNGVYWELIPHNNKTLFQQEIIDLDEKQEIVYENIKVPSKIDIGSGAIIEIFYRIREKNYTIENENNTLRNLRANYQSVYQLALENIIKYHKNIFYKYLGEKLEQEYAEKLQEFSNYEQYVNIIKYLINNARKQQLDKLIEYLNKEQKLINSTYYQLRALDQELVDTLGLSYSSSQNRLWGEYLSNSKDVYNQYFTDRTKFDVNNEPIIYTSEEIIEDTTITEELVKKQIEEYVYHNTDFRIDVIINKWIQTLDDLINDNNELIQQLGSSVYVQQYSEILEKDGTEIYFNNTGKDFDPKNSDILEYLNSFLKDYNFDDDIEDAYKFAYRKNIDNPLQIKDNSPKTYEKDENDKFIWNQYFFIDEQLNQINIQSDPYEAYNTGIQIQDDYKNLFNENSWIYKIYEALSEKATNSGFLKTENNNNNNNASNDSYNDKYTPFSLNMIPPYYSEISKDYTKPSNQADSHNMIFSLGVLEKNNTEYNINKINHLLETYLDLAYATLSDNEKANLDDNSINKIMDNLNLRDEILVLPNSIKDILKIYIKTYLFRFSDDGKSIRDIYQEIYACLSYQKDNLNTLSQDQIGIIQDTIRALAGDIEKKKSPDEEDIPTGNISFKNAWENFDTAIKKWNKDYYYQKGEDIQEKYEDISAAINNVNIFINIINNFAIKFKTYAEKNNLALQEYGSGDNIKVILQDENINYFEIQDHLKEVVTQYTHQLNIYQSSAILEGYFDFIKDYLHLAALYDLSDKIKYTQALNEVTAMAQVNLIANEENSPYHQQQLINTAWKNYVYELAKIYKTEIKERFD